MKGQFRETPFPPAEFLLRAPQSLVSLNIPQKSMAGVYEVGSL